MTDSKTRPVPQAFFSDLDIDIRAFSAQCEQQVEPDTYPLSDCCEKNVVIYDGENLRASTRKNTAIKTEFTDIFLNGPGVLAIKGFFENTNTVDAMSDVFGQILKAEEGFGEGDHFAQAGAQANGRIWNVFQKSAAANPEVFLDYYKNPLLRLVSEAWLGPHYQVTAQVNIVRPGGNAQDSHRDYHLGFQHTDELSRYPLHAQKMSAMLTLQGAVAHSDMPLESGPTKLLPFSQHYPLGYMSCRNPGFQDYFEQHHVQLPLQKGDALFFNPALIHAAGANQTTDVDRCANLLQISSAFGKPMETIDLGVISSQLFNTLSSKWVTCLSDDEKAAIVTAVADGYAFPTNLDTDSPVGGLAPESMSQLLLRALDAQWTHTAYKEALANQKQRRRA